MKKIILASVLSLVLLFAFGLDSKAKELAKEGTYSGKMVISGTVGTPLAFGEERLHFNYEYLGVFINDNGEGFLHNASVRGLGQLHAVKGVYEWDRSFAALTDLNGDQVFFIHEATGALGQSAKATFKWVGGTGKYAGIQGGGEWTWLNTRPAADGTFQGYGIHKGHWKLP